MGILDDIEIALEANDAAVRELSFKDIRRQARDFIKRYCQYGYINDDVYWDDHVIENNLWGKQCLHSLKNNARSINNTYDYSINFRPIKKETINVNERRYPFSGMLVYADKGYVKDGRFDLHPNKVYATTFECDHDYDSIILTPKTNSVPIVIKGYGGKQLPEWLMFEKSIYKQEGYRRTLSDDNHISFLLINCNLTEQEIINHVVNSDNVTITVDIIETI